MAQFYGWGTEMTNETKRETERLYWSGKCSGILGFSPFAGAQEYILKSTHDAEMAAAEKRMALALSSIYNAFEYISRMRTPENIDQAKQYLRYAIQALTD